MSARISGANAWLELQVPQEGAGGWRTARLWRLHGEPVALAFEARSLDEVGQVLRRYGTLVKRLFELPDRPFGTPAYYRMLCRAGEDGALLALMVWALGDGGHYEPTAFEWVTDDASALPPASA
ncbi:hypothetical protein [Streptomyces olivoreticuli]|uniref:hypothetical protein n=1 Tax=Streptomyces olivoreticuli TaxID=68246 RepID=UPI0013C34A99|nr:hypothetical protein [Streptomyces olivoreticuli]